MVGLEDQAKSFESMSKMWEHIRACYKYEPKVVPLHNAILGMEEAEAKKATHTIDMDGFVQKYDSDVYEDVWFEAKEKVKVSNETFIIYMRHKVFNGPKMEPKPLDGPTEEPKKKKKGK